MERATALSTKCRLAEPYALSVKMAWQISALAGRWLRSLEPKTHFPVCITQAILDRDRTAGALFTKNSVKPQTPAQHHLKLLEEAFAELGRIMPSSRLSR